MCAVGIFELKHRRRRMDFRARELPQCVSGRESYRHRAILSPRKHHRNVSLGEVWTQFSARSDQVPSFLPARCSNVFVMFHRSTFSPTAVLFSVLNLSNGIVGYRARRRPKFLDKRCFLPFKRPAARLLHFTDLFHQVHTASSNAPGRFVQVMWTVDGLRAHCTFSLVRLSRQCLHNISQSLGLKLHFNHIPGSTTSMSCGVSSEICLDLSIDDAARWASFTLDRRS